MTAHSITILTELEISSYMARTTHSINCAISCTLLKAVSNVQPFLSFVIVIGTRHALLDKAVNK